MLLICNIYLKDLTNTLHSLKKITHMTNILPVQALFLRSIHLEQSNFPSTKEGIWEVGKPRAASSFVILFVNFLFCLQVRYHLEIYFVALISLFSTSPLQYKWCFEKWTLFWICPSQNTATFIVSQKTTAFVKVTLHNSIHMSQ